MNTLDRRVTSIANHERYVKETWGQRPARDFRFHFEGTRMYGVVMPDGSVPTHTPLNSEIWQELADEISQWDALSDEALLDFESSLD